MNTQSHFVGTPDASAPLAATIRTRLAEFVAPRVKELDFWIDARLVRTLVATVESILLFRNRAQGLLLSELGGYLLSREHAPALSSKTNGEAGKRTDWLYDAGGHQHYAGL